MDLFTFKHFFEGGVSLGSIVEHILSGPITN
jgi:hypothetical protein